MRLKSISNRSSVATGNETADSSTRRRFAPESGGMTMSLLESSAAPGCADVVEGDGAGAEKNQGEGESCEGERELVSVLA